ncbi:hypothetical protein HYPSUDRAFT_114830, partial [Hypholoma sublateritium FD-334 SS-4]
WIDGCDKFKIPITAERAKGPVAQYRESRGDPSAESAQAAGNRPPDIPAYSYEAFVDAITEFVIADDQSINVIESPFLRRIFMLLRQDLSDNEIPHRSAIQNRIKSFWEEHLGVLEGDMKAFLYILDRLLITSKIGWVTLDNASNNDTFMIALERELQARDIPFDHIENRI